MSTTIKNQLSLLVLGEHIYSKRRDGYFYPSHDECIENDDIHTVKFSDGDDSKKLVLEEHLTWLGFWDVPRPKLNSLIQGTVFTSNEFDGEARTQFVDERSALDLKTRRATSFSLLKSSDDEDDVRLIHKPSRPASRSSTIRSQPHCADHQQCIVVDTHGPLMTGPQNPRDITQQRSSVLRLNRKALSREISTNNNMVDLCTSLSSSWKRSTNTDLHPTLSIQSMAKYIKNKRSNFDLVPASTRRRTPCINMRNDTQFFERYTDCEAPEIMSLHQRHFENEDEFDASGAIVKRAHSSARYPDAPYESLDWFETSNINQSDPMPLPPSRLQDTNPLELSHTGFTSSITLQPQNIGHQAESQMRTIGIGLMGRKRRRDNRKKCRKVYGLVNRQLWCTQCKWKKACSRFKA